MPLTSDRGSLRADGASPSPASTPSDVQLAACPFCGVPMLSAEAQVSDGDFGGFLVWCDNCGAEGPTAETEAEAIVAWNRRSDTAKAELVEARNAALEEAARIVLSHAASADSIACNLPGRTDRIARQHFADAEMYRRIARQIRALAKASAESASTSQSGGK